MTARPRVFLDLDGCLVDSLGPISSCLRLAFADLGLEPPDLAALRPLIGPPFAFTIPALLASGGVDPDRTDELIAAYRVHYAVVSVRDTRPVPGIPEALQALRDGGWSMVLCTSKPHPSCDQVAGATGLSPLLDGVFGPPSFTEAGEPKTATLARARQAHPGPAVMVGDREHDLLAGASNRTATIGVTWGIGDAAELRAAGADLVLDEPADLPSAVAALLG